MKWLACVRSSCAIGLCGGVLCAQGLQEVCQDVLKDHPLLIQANEQREQAEQEYRSVLAEWFPQLSFAWVSQYDGAFPSISSSQELKASLHQGTLAVQQKVFDKSAWDRLRAAAVGTWQAELHCLQTKEQLWLETCAAYFEVLLALHALQQTKASVRAIQQERVAAEVRCKVGLSPEADLQEAQAALDLACTEEMVTRNRLANAVEALRCLTHQSYDQLRAVAAAGLRPWKHPALPLSASVESLVANSLEIQAVRLQVEQAKYAWSAAKAGHLPTVTLQGSAAQNWYTAKPRPVGAGREYIATIALQLPLFSGGGVSARSRKAASQVAYAEAQQQAVRRTFVQQLHSAVHNYQTAKRSLLANQQVLLSANAACAAIESGYETGLRTFTEKLQAIAKRYDAEKRLKESECRYLESYIALITKTRRLTLEDIAVIDERLLLPVVVSKVD